MPSSPPRRPLASAWAWMRDLTTAIDVRLSLRPDLATARWPGVRRVARRRAGALFDLCAGFVYSQVLAACVAADLFALAREHPLDAARLAAHLDAPEDAVQRLLEAAAALDLLHRRRDGRYGLGSLGAAVAADPGIAAMVAHHRLLYADLADPLALLRSPAPGLNLSAFWPYDDSAASPDAGEGVVAYTDLMARSQAMVARQVLATVRFAGHRRLLDLGGGNGAFLRAVAARHPHLRLALVDLPPVAQQARLAFAKAGIDADVFGGDVREAAFPAGTDIVSLVRVLHDHEDTTVRQVLANVRRQLAPGGTLLVVEPLADTPGAERVGNAYFPIYLKAMGRGRTRSRSEYVRMLRAAGFGRITCPATPLPMVASVLLARVP